MFKKLLPQTTNFFKYFEQHSQLSKEVCIELDKLAANLDASPDSSGRIKELEHKADGITHQCIDALHSTFITPFDRSDIHRLIRRLDDVIDAVDSAASRILIYRLKGTRPELRQLTQVLIESTAQLDAAIGDLANINKKADEIKKCCLAVFDAESRADDILRSAIVRLMAEEKDPIQVIKWKEIFERLERATDLCQEVANIISGIIIEAS